MSEHVSLYTGLDEHEPDPYASEAFELSEESTPKRRYSTEHELRKELQPSIKAAQEKLSRRALTLAESAPWDYFALCAYLLPHEKDLFTSENSKDEQKAELYCESCTVGPECLGRALYTNEMIGTYGGVTAKERRAARRRAHWM